MADARRDLATLELQVQAARAVLTLLQLEQAQSGRPTEPLKLIWMAESVASPTPELVGAGISVTDPGDSVDTASPAPTPARDGPAPLPVTQQLTAVDLERRLAHLREANAQLLLAALSAQDLQGVADKARQRQTQFLAVVAHELRSPLAPISNAAALLGMLPTDELLPELQAIIQRQVSQLSRLVDDLLDISRASTGKLRLDRRVIDLSALIDEVVDTRRAITDARQQRLEVQVPARPLPMLADPVRLTQIIGNLLDNASRYTPVGGQIGLCLEVADETVVLTVSDNGIGITAEALAGIFEPFVQDPHAIGFDGKGLGIGLAVVRQLVEAHGGTVAATSAGRGLGSQFAVTLPITPTVANPA